MRILGFMLLTLAVFGGTGPVRADDPEKTLAAVAESAQEEDAASAPVNPHIAAMTEKAKELADILTADEARDLGAVRDNFGVLRSIGIVRDNVTDAVGQCADQNPDLADPIRARLKDWRAAVDPAATAQEKNLEVALSAARFGTHLKSVRGYLDTVEEAATYANARIDRTVVTTPEACTGLMNSMDETQALLLDMLGEMPWPGAPVGGGDAAP